MRAHPGLQTIVAVAVLAAPAATRGDGAFPDSMRILVPADHPEQILLGTTFGLVVSVDGGAHFHLVCEESIVTPGDNVMQYVMGPPLAPSIYALTLSKLAVSTDLGCSWTAAAGTWTNPSFTDVFPDPTDAGRVFAVASTLTGEGWFASSVFDSTDSGRTFGPPLLVAPQSVFITGVESAASDPATVYATEFGNPPSGFVSQLARSTNGGATFGQSDLLGLLGNGEPRLAAVDPVDAGVIYYRVLGNSGDQLAISRDGGQTARAALSVDGFLTTFLRRHDGALLVGTQLQGAFISQDGGETFAPWPEAPHLRALAERAGVLYAAADNAADGYALGTSSDGGKTWTPLLRFANLCGIRGCAPTLTATCQAAWTRLVDLLGITGCADAPATPAPVPAPKASAASGSGCSLAPAGRGPSGLPTAIFMLAAVGAAARRRDRAST